MFMYLLKGWVPERLRLHQRLFVMGRLIGTVVRWVMFEWYWSFRFVVGVAVAFEVVNCGAVTISSNIQATRAYQTAEQLGGAEEPYYMGYGCFVLAETERWLKFRPTSKKGVMCRAWDEHEATSYPFLRPSVNLIRATRPSSC